MLKLISRNQIDVEKYNACIEDSSQSKVSAFSWYLDIVAENWKVLVLNDYEAVMPLPYRKKFGLLSYVYPPFWLLELGIFSKSENVDQVCFLQELKRKFWFIETRMNAFNSLELIGNKSKLLQFQSLDIRHEDFDKHYKSDRRKDLKRAIKNGLKLELEKEASKLIHLFKVNVGTRTPNITSKDFTTLEKLITECVKRNKGEVLNIYDQENRLVASGFFLFHQKEVTILVSSTDFKNRKNGANTYLIHKAIERYQEQFNVFNFGGSSIETVAKYFQSFGALTNEYLFFKQSLI